MSLLELADLAVSFPSPDGAVHALRGVSLTLDPGRTLGVVGESGSGKSTAALAILGLNRGARVSGRIGFDGQDLLSLGEDRLREVRGSQIGMVFQDPLSSLHPYYTVGRQIAEAIRAHEDVGAKAARRRAADLLRLVGIPEPERRADDYPHEFSGGMRQRVMLAMAVALRPKLLIADEPTTALDATVQAQILELIMRLQREYGMAVLLITHDLGVVAAVADEVMVMYAGRVVESADSHTAFHRPHHPYTLGLLASLPGPRGQRLRPIPGQPPSLLRMPDGCPFQPRCDYAMHQCAATEPPLLTVTGGPAHRSACWLPSGAVGRDDGAERIRARAIGRKAS
ncbi:ABC transporter ATP-binding protein [Nonomuraea sp. SYSU D8015]|uniref:ABC transporter ATP-binding protein n=1 Tax=Nonomuraea sp. SYSU D8015 TaxID=2593644 RepID=UPI00166083CC|nr:ABC transporter ATP-binding protein [Nonomuraea sp. SYSU D8015]